MREDMSRVIVERPRCGGHGARKGRNVPLDDLPSHQGMRRRWREAGDCKMLNENLNPLRRYLERQVGRPWNKIYSEIAARLRADSTVQQHVRDHLRDFVAIHPQRRSGTAHVLGGGKKLCDRLWYQPLYVDPDDGILKRTDRLPEAKAARRVREQPTKRDRIALAPDCELRLVAGIWYEVRLAPLPEPVFVAATETRKLPLKPYHRTGPVVEVTVTVRRLVTPAVFDVVSGALVPVGPETDEERAWKDYRRLYPDRRHAVEKRVLSHAELRRHRLRNDPPVN
jgi:hypothetical protein